MSTDIVKLTKFDNPTDLEEQKGDNIPKGELNPSNKHLNFNLNESEEDKENDLNDVIDEENKESDLNGINEGNENFDYENNDSGSNKMNFNRISEKSSQNDFNEQNLSKKENESQIKSHRSHNESFSGSNRLINKNKRKGDNIVIDACQSNKVHTVNPNYHRQMYNTSGIKGINFGDPFYTTGKFIQIQPHFYIFNQRTNDLRDSIYKNDKKCLTLKGSLQQSENLVRQQATSTITDFINKLYNLRTMFNKADKEIKKAVFDVQCGLNKIKNSQVNIKKNIHSNDLRVNNCENSIGYRLLGRPNYSFMRNTLNNLRLKENEKCGSTNYDNYGNYGIKTNTTSGFAGFATTGSLNKLV